MTKLEVSAWRTANRFHLDVGGIRLNEKQRENLANIILQALRDTRNEALEEAEDLARATSEEFRQQIEKSKDPDNCYWWRGKSQGANLVALGIRALKEPAE